MIINYSLLIMKQPLTSRKETGSSFQWSKHLNKIFNWCIFALQEWKNKLNKMLLCELFSTINAQLDLFCVSRLWFKDSIVCMKLTKVLNLNRFEALTIAHPLKEVPESLAHFGWLLLKWHSTTISNLEKEKLWNPIKIRKASADITNNSLSMK